jgi:hypothetical protein
MKPGDRRGARLAPWIVFLVAVCILTPAFLGNPWLAVGEDWFLGWRTAQDASLVGRLVQSRQDGLLSHAALLGLGEASIFSSPQLLQRQYDPYFSAGLLITTILSLAAPLSWFVLFKAHSYLHPHLNFIVWQMPTVLLGFGVSGAIAQSLLELILRHSNA